MIEIVGCLEEIGEVCNLDLDKWVELIIKGPSQLSDPCLSINSPTFKAVAPRSIVLSIPSRSSFTDMG